MSPVTRLAKFTLEFRCLRILVDIDNDVAHGGVMPRYASIAWAKTGARRHPAGDH